MLSDGTFTLTERTQATLEPSAVLVLHKAPASHPEDNVKAVTYHPLIKGTIQQGYAIDKALLIEAIGNEERCSDKWLEPTTLIDSAAHAMWYRPKQKRTLYFSGAKGNVQFSAPFPATLFYYHKHTRDIRLFALSSDKRPTKDSMLYLLPVGNVSATGSLCQSSGASFLPEAVQQDNFDQVERVFFDALSTHTNCEHLFKKDVKAKRKTPFAEIIRFWQHHAQNNSVPSVKRHCIAYTPLKNFLSGIGA